MIACFMGGLALGAIINYLVETRPLQSAYASLVDKMYRMKKQGFVPQYHIKQRIENDPSEDIIEY